MNVAFDNYSPDGEPQTATVTINGTTLWVNRVDDAPDCSCGAEMFEETYHFPTAGHPTSDMADVVFRCVGCGSSRIATRRR